MALTLEFVALAGAMTATAAGLLAPALRGLPQATYARLRATLWIGLPAAAFGLYAWLGQPGALQASPASDPQPIAATPPPAAQREAELAAQLQRQPNDARALVLKARLDMEAARYASAAELYERALALPAKVSRDATVWAEYAEARGMQQGGHLGGPVPELINKALALDPDNPLALDLAGSAAWERGEFKLAAAHWQRLLTQLEPGTKRHRELAAAIARAESAK